MLSMSTQPVSPSSDERFNDEALNQLRKEADPVVDRLVEELAAEHRLEAVNAVLSHLIGNNEPLPEALPPRIERWLRHTARLPAWADRERLDRASALFARHGVTICLILATDALLQCYAMKSGVRVLASSYRLGHSAYHRIAETTQFVLLVMAPGGLYEDGKGVRVIQKVRLMHAAIRCLLQRSHRWPGEELGAPICQEDMLLALVTFSWVVVRGLRRLGVHVDDELAEDYHYFWRVVGDMLGIRPSHTPASIAEAAELFERITQRHHGPSAEGAALTRALLEFHADLVPGKLFDGLMPAVMRRLAGDRVADWLDVPRSQWDLIVSHPRTFGLYVRMLDHLGTALVTRQLVALGEYERAGFQIPTSLREAWSLADRRAQVGVPRATTPSALGA